MRTAKFLMLSAAFLVGCTVTDENPNWNPKAEYPAWAYDAPHYYHPTEDLEVAEVVGDGMPVYYTRSDYFFIRHPGGCQLIGVPRVAVWSSSDQGRRWEKAGYYGVEQSHFLFKAEDDGEYWIRFVGPGQGVSEVPPGMPHRIYVVDRRPPKVLVKVIPGPWRDAEKKVPYTYRVGETVTLSWLVSDEHLAARTLSVGTCFAGFPHNLVWSQIPEPLPARHSMPVELPPEAAKDGGIRFRVQAGDKAGNTGMGLTDVMIVSGGKPTSQPTVQPSGPFELIVQNEGAKEAKPGWPMPGAVLRGGTTRVLNWMPETAAKYETLELQFSSNTGQTWRTVATGLKYGKSVKWTVPLLTSRNCLLRIVATTKADKDVQKIMLAATQRFHVDSVVPDTVLGPEVIQPDRPGGE